MNFTNQAVPKCLRFDAHGLNSNEKKFEFELVYLTIYYTIQTFNDPNKEIKLFKTWWNKGEYAGNQHFLLSPPCFLPHQRQKSSFVLHLFCHLRIFSMWSCPKFCCVVKSYRQTRFIWIRYIAKSQ